MYYEKILLHKTKQKVYLNQLKIFDKHYNEVHTLCTIKVEMGGVKQLSQK